ncbi:uncharacterized protein BYT42DRAFT_256672 [Radiomyces spectabilis]|uniref:uncharacterized protein n=1 Tax=Radiomyces spectabilis TaxID=64574 RepID=UPI002220E749|nr:uncharacterized protein BYT42DRAFT_256672 [Radiomyces spectabilis]KAI8384311.1 hypothetical protein BYT42DRAFT_256672 [Radiomyces spectabilis]
MLRSRINVFRPFIRTVHNKAYGKRNPSEGSEPSMPSSSGTKQQLPDDIMIPGQFLRFFKQKKPKTWTPEKNTSVSLHRQGARALNHNEFDSTPTVMQARMAQRIQRALLTMYATEALPTALITPQHLKIHDIKVSRNLRKCRILYDPIDSNKTKRGNVHGALIDHAVRLEALIRFHGQLHRPVSIKFVPDTDKKQLDQIFEQLSLELKDTKEPNDGA